MKCNDSHQIFSVSYRFMLGNKYRQSSSAWMRLRIPRASKKKTGDACRDMDMILVMRYFLMTSDDILWLRWLSELSESIRIPSGHKNRNNEHVLLMCSSCAPLNTSHSTCPILSYHIHTYPSHSITTHISTSQMLRGCASIWRRKGQSQKRLQSFPHPQPRTWRRNCGENRGTAWKPSCLAISCHLKKSSQ